MCSDGLIDLYMYDDVRDLTTLKEIADHIVVVVAGGNKLCHKICMPMTSPNKGLQWSNAIRTLCGLANAQSEHNLNIMAPAADL
jgi:hypothetical protein